MTNDQLQAIEDRLSKATPGPWEAGRYKPVTGLVHKIGELGPVAVTRANKSQDRDDSDARFIAHAPTDIAALIKALKEARSKTKTIKLEFYAKGYVDGKKDAVWTLEK